MENLLDKLLRDYVFIPTESETFNQVFGGIHLGTYYVVAAPPKAGKTTFIDSLFVVPYLYKFVQLNQKIRFIYFNLEMDRNVKLINLALAYVNRRLDTKVTFDMLVRAYRMYAEDESSLSDLDKDYIDKVQAALAWLDKKIKNRDFILYDRVSYNDFRDICKEEFEAYPEVHHMVIIDHMRRVDIPYFEGMKQKVDALSSVIVDLRNEYRQTFVCVIHTNRNFSYKNISKNSIPVPLPEDIKDTGNLSEDADYIFTFSNPHVFKLSMPDMIIDGKCLDDLPKSARIIALVESRYSDCPKHLLTSISNTKLMIMPGLINESVGINSNIEENVEANYATNGSPRGIVEEVPDSFWPGGN